MTSRHWFISLVILNILDFMLSAALINIHGVEIEGNPILRHLIILTGSLWSMFMVKTGALIVLAVGLAGEFDDDQSKVNFALKVVNVIYLCVVIYSLVLLLLL